MPTLGLRYAACAGVEAGKPIVEIAIRRSIRNWRDPEHRGTQARRGRRTRRRHRDGHVVDDRDGAGRNGVLDPAQPHRPHLLRSVPLGGALSWPGLLIGMVVHLAMSIALGMALAVPVTAIGGWATTTAGGVLAGMLIRGLRCPGGLVDHARQLGHRGKR
jgi:hypothetical protein